MIFPERFLWKTFSSLCFAVFLVSLFFGTFLYQHLYETTFGNLQANLKKETETLAEMALNSPGLLATPGTIARIVPTEDRITIIAIDGTVLADNWAERMGKEALENHADRPEFKAALAGTPTFKRRFSHTIQTEMLYYAIPVKHDGKTIFILRLSFALTSFYAQMTKIRNFLLLAALLAILASLPFSYLISIGTTRQLQRIRHAAQQLSSGNLTQEVPVAGALELQELARAFNTMAGDLRSKIHSIRQENARTDALLSRMVEGVLAIDRRGKAVFANAAFCRMIGLPLDRIRGRSFLEITRNDQLSGYLSQLLAEAGKGSIDPSLLAPKEIRFGGLEGESIFSVQASLISDGSEGLVLLVFHDITRTKMVEQIRKDFVDNVSHELRTPLTALKGSIEILLDGAYLHPEESRKFLQIMDKQLSGVQNLVSDMLKLAAVEDVHTSIRRETVDLSTFLRDIIATLEPVAQRKHQTLIVHEPDGNVALNIDPAHIADAVLNVIDNAIKYTQEGGKIEVEVRVNSAGLLIEISDNGPGIAADQIPRIFERFYRVDKSRSREVGGTGLGLSIAKHAVENHGGTITVHSEPGQGSTFLIRLPETAVLPVARRA